MVTKTKTAKKDIVVRTLPALLLIFALGVPALSAPAVASADDTTASIMVFAPGAAQGAPVWVEYQDVMGNWQKVNGWLGTLDDVTATGTPFKGWAVEPANYGQGPFRWVVLSLDGSSVWGISDSFNMPPGGGLQITETIVPGVTGGMTATATTAPAATAIATPAATSTTTTTTPVTATVTASAPAATPSMTATTAPAGATQLTDTGSSVFSYASADSSIISGYFTGLPATSWIAVQWGDGQGNWMTVPGWEGTADTVEATTGQLSKVWTVFPANYGQGPFRWAVFDRQGGTLMAFSAPFSLPADSGLNVYRSLAK
jgi:hypothetical protein